MRVCYTSETALGVGKNDLPNLLFLEEVRFTRQQITKSAVKKSNRFAKQERRAPRHFGEAGNILY